ncbi:hypothetical protein BDW66DRAFT_139836 [Aspergillus desertorum]
MSCGCLSSLVPRRSCDTYVKSSRFAWAPVLVYHGRESIGAREASFMVPRPRSIKSAISVLIFTPDGWNCFVHLVLLTLVSYRQQRVYVIWRQPEAGNAQRGWRKNGTGLANKQKKMETKEWEMSKECELHYYYYG